MSRRHVISSGRNASSVMRLPKKLSRSLLYFLLIVLSCIIIRDSLIILGVRYKFFVNQNIWLREGKRKDVGNPEKLLMNRRREERPMHNQQNQESNVRSRRGMPEERKRMRAKMIERRQRRQKRMEERRKKQEERAKKKNSNEKNKKKKEEKEVVRDKSLLEYLKQRPFGSDGREITGKSKLVLLLAYPRSGSSFIGQVLSAYNHTMYFFEPLFLLIKETYDVITTEAAPTFLDKIYGCDPNITSYLKKKNFVVKSKKEQCETTEMILVKTIRLRLKIALEWLQLNPQIKVVHLVRDPRGILASMQKGPFRQKNTTVQCQYLYEDYHYGKQLHKSRYIRIKYEDFVDKPMTTFKKAFQFLDVPFSKDVEESVIFHTKAEALNTTDKPKPKMFKIGSYYSLYRFSNFRHDHTWTRMIQTNIEIIERNCEDVMKSLGYKPKYYKPPKH